LKEVFQQPAKAEGKTSKEKFPHRFQTNLLLASWVEAKEAWKPLIELILIEMNNFFVIISGRIIKLIMISRKQVDGNVGNNGKISIQVFGKQLAGKICGEILNIQIYLGTFTLLASGHFHSKVLERKGVVEMYLKSFSLCSRCLRYLG
jgi:hypothetical protein